MSTDTDTTHDIFTPPEQDALALEEIVTIHPMYARKNDGGRFFRVTKVPTAANAVNYHVQPTTGGGRGVMVKRSQVLRATPDQAAAAKAQAEAAPPAPTLHLGSVVRFVPGKPQAHAGLFVVIKHSGNGVNLAKLGGNVKEQYWQGVAAPRLEIVNVSEIVERWS